MAIAGTILMIRPAAFGFNEETAANNYFQQQHSTSDTERIRTTAVREFDAMVEILRSNDIEIIVVEDTGMPAKPSAVFPNNWISTSPDGVISVFPMYAPSRREEKREDILKMLAGEFIVKDVQDWSEFEVEGKFLEGTGSMVMDHTNRVIYAVYSPRTDISVLEKFANANNYRAIVFVATDKNGQAIYHTNVVMTLGEDFAILCEEAIDEEWELIAVKQLLESTGHEIIRITREQMHSFAGNMLQVKNKRDEKILVMSEAAFNSLSEDQRQQLAGYCKLLPIPVPTIEQEEGGSVRCMMAEIFLQKK